MSKSEGFITHWHFETVPHHNGNVGSLPSGCECDSHAKHGDFK